MLYVEKESIDGYTDMFKNDWEELDRIERRTTESLYIPGVDFCVFTRIQCVLQGNIYTGSRRIICSISEVRLDKVTEVTFYDDNRAVDILYKRGTLGGMIKGEEINSYVKYYMNWDEIEYEGILKDEVSRMLGVVDKEVDMLLGDTEDTEEGNKRFRTKIKEFFLG